MVFPSVDNFLKIFRFYRLNSVKSVREINEYRYRYDSVDKYFEAFNYAYDAGETGLVYPEHKDEIEGALNARFDLTKYFNAAGFPGSYAFNTPDCFMMKSIVLDWASTIKTFQDSTAQCTNAYQLSSDDVDKAIRGFGIDFVNSRTVTSLNRRQTFLLNMCDLYKIKGSPASIIKTLNIMGIDDIYISEAWVYPTRDGHKNVEIKWLPVEPEQTFDTSSKSYSHEENLNTEYWTWGKFVTELDAINDAHWFYTKEDIIKMNWKDEDTFIHLPSITPYFNINVKLDSKKNELGINKIQKLVQNQLAAYLNGIEITNDIPLESYGKSINLLSCWNAFLYVLARYSDFMRYYEFKMFIKKFINTEFDFTTSSTKYLDLIYRVYSLINNTKDENLRTSYKNIIRLYVPSAVPNGYCSYNEIRYWWLNNKHTQDDFTNGLIRGKSIITPNKCKATQNSSAYEVFWTEDYNYGYYDLEVFYDNEWHVVYSDARVNCQQMQRIFYTEYDKKEITFTDLNDLKNKVRIVHYRTENNIPDIFFTKPFYFDNSERDTTLDTIYHLNDEAVHDTLYKNSVLYKLFGENYKNTINNFDSVDLYKNLLENIKSIGVRATDRDLKLKSYINSAICYPKSLRIEDKDVYIDNILHEYISDCTSNYLDYVSHDGSELNYINLNYNFKEQKTEKFPRNTKWNWAVSYGQNKDTTYYFINYEANKWCRVKSGRMVTDQNISLDTSIFSNDYGVPVYKNGSVYIHVRKNNNAEEGTGSWIKFDENSFYEDKWNALKYSEKDFDYSEEKVNFLKEMGCGYKFKTDGKITVDLPPSDIYPSDVLNQHQYNVYYQDSDGNISKKPYSFYFCDCAFKPESKLARQVVVARIEPEIAQSFYESVAQASIDKNYYSTKSTLQESLIDVYLDPFYSNQTVNYSYDLFLNYLYKNGYTVDINTGYIFKPFHWYLDEVTNYLYIQCVDLDDTSTRESVIYRWIRVKVSRQWDDNENRKSIYYQLDENGEYVYSGGKKIPVYNCGGFTPDLSYRNVYDAERYLSDPVISGMDYTYAEADKEHGHYMHRQVPDGSGFRCEIKNDYIGKESEISTKYVQESKIESYDLNGNETLTQLDCPLFNSVNFGINQDLKDFIDANLTKQVDSIDAYEELIVELSQALQDYTETNIGFTIKFDVYSSHIFSSSFVKMLIDFYKPKRARFLKLTSSVEASIDTVYDIAFGDQDYNHVFLNDPNNAKEKYLGNRSVIKQEVNEYVPFNDMIFLQQDRFGSDVNSFREVYPYANTDIPTLETYEKIDHLDNYTVKIGNVVVKSCFYCTGFQPDVNGFYYKYDNEYFLNDYVFEKLTYEYNSKYNPDTGLLNPGGSYKKRTFTRWFLFKKVLQTLGLYNFEYVSEPDVGDVPYLHSDGTPLKYMKVTKRIQSDDEFIQYMFSNKYSYGDFQHWTEENAGYIKMNMENLSPVFYMANFEDDNINGFYYTNGKTRFGYPVYFNQHGKMISCVDLKTIPNRYMEYSIGEYFRDNCKSFWIVTDYKEIPDISEASHIAYNTDDSIFNLHDANRTKTFYKTNSSTTDLGEMFFVSGVYGYNVKYVEEHPDCILKYKWSMNREKYGSESNYSDLVARRVNQNTLPIEYEPVSNIQYQFGFGLTDEYKGTDGNSVSKVIWKRNGKDVQLFKKCYRTDPNGYESGAIGVNVTDRVEFTTTVPFVTDQVNHVTAHFKIRNRLYKEVDYTNFRTAVVSTSDGNWHTYDLIYRYDNGHDYDLYVDGVLKLSAVQDNSEQWTFEECELDVSETCFFNKVIPSWYLKIISDYGVFGYRKEQSKQYKHGTSVYTPMFNTEMPRTCYGRYVTGLPQTIQGGRVCSKIKRFDGTEDYIQPLSGQTTYKWNADYMYKPNDPKEVSILWSKKTCNRIYDRTVTPQLDGQGNVVGVQIKRDYRNPFVNTRDESDIFCMRQQKFFMRGVELYAPANFNCHVFETVYDSFIGKEVETGNNTYIPCWWSRDRKDYTASVVETDSTLLGVREYIDDDYPVVNHGDKKTNYFDQDCRFDGACNGNEEWYCNPKFDRNTLFVKGLNKKVEKSYGCDNGYTLNGKSFDPRSFNNVPVENIGDSFHNPYNDELVNATAFYEPNLDFLTTEMKDNGIFHEVLRLDYTCEFDTDISGVYKVTNKFLRKDKLDLCLAYSSKRTTKDYCTYYPYLKNGQVYEMLNNVPEIVYLLNENVAVPMYDPKSNCYLWQVRNYSYAICKPEKTFDNEVYRTLTNIKRDGVKQSLVVCEKIVAQTLIQCRYVIDKNDRHYTFINQLQRDLCGQVLCKYDPTVLEQIRVENKYGSVKQEPVNVFFRNYWSFKFVEVEDVVHVTDKKFTDNSVSTYELFEQNLYVNVDGRWIGPYVVNKNDVLDYEKLEKVRYGINVVFIGDKLCVRTQSDLWVSVKHDHGFVGTSKKLYTNFMNGNNVIVNVPYTNPSNSKWDWNYNFDVPEILATVARLRKFHNNGTDQFNKFGKEWKQSKNDHKAYGNPDRDCTFVDNVRVGTLFSNAVEFVPQNKNIVRQRNLKKIDLNNYTSKQILELLNQVVGCITNGTANPNGISTKSSYLINNPEIEVVNAKSYTDLAFVEKLNEVVDNLTCHTVGKFNDQSQKVYLKTSEMTGIETDYVLDESMIINKLNEIIMYIQSGNSVYLT